MATEQNVQVNITNPEQPFGGVLIMTPGSAPPPEAPDPTLSPVQSVFGRDGDVVGLHGDYTLDKIAEPVANFTLPGSVRIKADNSFQIWNPDQNKWHTLLVRGAADAMYITIGPGES